LLYKDVILITSLDTILSKYGTTLRTATVIETPKVFDKSPRVDRNVPDEFKMDFSRFIQKPFLITTQEFKTTDAKFSVIGRYTFPEIIMDNATASVPFLHSCLYRIRTCVALQLSGTPSHQGCLLVAAIPPATPAPTNPNTILAAPHVFLNANEATSVCLEAPMFTPSQLLRTTNFDSSGSNKNSTYNSVYANAFDIVVFVMNPLSASTGASTSVTLSMHALFEEADFYVPKNGVQNWTQQSFIDDIRGIPTMILDRTASGLKSVVGDVVDMSRNLIKKWTGFHNPNVPTIDHRVITASHNFSNNVDIPQFYEVMDPHAKFSRIYDDFYFRTSQDEMDLRYLLSKPVYIGTAKLSSSKGVGSRLMSYPITPMVEASTSAGSASLDWYSMMRTIYECSRLWRGSLKLHVQAVCTNFHYCKLVFYKDYSCATGITYNISNEFYPKYEDVHNLTLDTIEFSAGGQVQTIDLPYCAVTNQLECTKDFITNAVSHGMVHCYVVQPLVYNNNVPTTVEFNFYISGGDDLEFSGYDTDNFLAASPGPTSLEAAAFNSPLADDSLIDLKSDNEVINMQPQSGIPTFVDTAPQDELLNTVESYNEFTKMSVRPNTSIRDYLRRMHPTRTYTHTVVEGEADLLYVVNLTECMMHDEGLHDAFSMMSSHYLGLSGGLKVKIRVADGLGSSLFYVPPSSCSTRGDSPFYVKTFSTLPSALAGNSAALLSAAKQFFPLEDGKLYPIPLSELPGCVYNTTPLTHTDQFEVAIPNLNPHCFVGTSHKWTNESDTLSDSLGYIVVAVKLSDVGTTVKIVTSLALNDESRLGFQVYNPKKTVNSFKATFPSPPPNPPGTQTMRDSVQTTSPIENTTYGGLPLSLLPLGGYYFSTT